MHKTNTGEKRKALRKEALELSKKARIASKAALVVPEARTEARRLQGEADSALAEALSLKDAARLEDLHLWKMQKERISRRGTKKYEYWMASWRENSKVRNVHLGSCKKLDHQAALQKARAMKAEALAERSACGKRRRSR